MDENNSENSNKYSHDNKLGVTMIPFTFRKSPILSIIFRSLDLEMGQFRLKIESDTEKTSKIEGLTKIEKDAKKKASKPVASVVVAILTNSPVLVGAREVRPVACW